MDKRENISRNFLSNKNSNNISKDINKSIINKDYSNYVKKIDLITENSTELVELRALWNELGVTESFISNFENIAMELDTNIRKDYFNFELNNLNKLKEQIQVNFLSNITKYYIKEKLLYISCFLQKINDL